jgi:hypothetical protein
LLFLFCSETASSEYHTFLSLAMTFMWGVQDSAVNTHTSEVMGFEFEDNSRPYSVNNLVQALGVFIFEGVEAFLKGNKKSFIIYSIIVGVLGILMNACTFFGFEFTHGSEEDDELLFGNN